ncbi:MAG: site-2 protease family protein, partial [Clostridiales bacterium]
MSIIWAILIFCILIISHEFGHFIVAKLNGIYVYDFNLGMGPKIFSFKAKETEYTLRLFPIGGAVRMMGEDESADDPRAFNQKSVLQRMSVVFAGPLMNFIMAIIIFVIVFMGMGMPSNNNVVGKV